MLANRDSNHIQTATTSLAHAFRHDISVVSYHCKHKTRQVPALQTLLHHSTAQHSTAQHSTAQHSTAQHSTAQHSSAQHRTAQHSTMQHQQRVASVHCSAVQHAQHGTYSAAMHSTGGLRHLVHAPGMVPVSQAQLVPLGPQPPH